MITETDYERDLHDLKYNAWNVSKSPVKQYDENGKCIRRYDSMSEASKQNHIPVGNISRCCQRKAKSAGGFMWLYADI